MSQSLWAVFSLSHRREPVMQGFWHRKGIDATREFIVSFEPGLAKADDRLIRAHWPSFRKNHNVVLKRSGKENSAS